MRLEELLVLGVASAVVASLLARAVTALDLWTFDLPGVEMIAAPVFATAITIGWKVAKRH